MKFVILGATGPTGVQLVEECLEQGHTVIALVRSPDKLQVKHKNLSIQKVDIFKEEDLVPHMRGTDAVFTCVGSHAFFWSACSIYYDSMKVITSAMRESGVARVVAMSSWGTKYDADQYWVVKYLLRHVFLKNVLQNMGEMEDFLANKCSDLDFTVVRPAQLTNSKSSGKDVIAVDGQYVSDVQMSIPRRDVAKFMLHCVVTGEWKKKHVAIGIK